MASKYSMSENVAAKLEKSLTEQDLAEAGRPPKLFSAGI